MALCAKDVQTSEFAHALAKDNVRAAASHVRGNGHVALLACLGNDLCFLGVVLGIEHAVGDADLLETGREHFRGLDGNGAHKYGLPCLIEFAYGFDNGVELFPARLVDEIWVVLADHGPVGGDGHDLKVVDLVEFDCFRVCRTGHAGQLVVHSEVVLEGDGGERLVLGLDANVLLGLQSLVQAVGIAAAGHDAACEFVDDDNLVVLDNVVHIALEVAVGLQRLQDVVLGQHVARIKEVVEMGQLLAVGYTLLRQGRCLGLFVHAVVVGIELADHCVHGLVEVHVLVRGTGNDERSSCLIDEDGVHFVHDGKIVAALHKIRGVEFHVVAQVVEAELVVGAVGDVRGIGCPALVVVEIVHNNAGCETKEGIDLSHPGGVALGQIVVDCDNVHALARKGVQRHGQGCHQGLAFACLHFGNASLVQDYAAYELYVKVAHAKRSLGCLANQGKDLRQDAVQGLGPFLHGLPVFSHALGKFLVRKLFNFGFKGIYLLHQGAQFFQISVVLAAEYFLKKGHEDSSLKI